MISMPSSSLILRIGGFTLILGISTILLFVILEILFPLHVDFVSLITIGILLSFVGVVILILGAILRFLDRGKKMRGTKTPLYYDKARTRKITLLKKVGGLVFDSILLFWGSLSLYRSLTLDPLADENSFWTGIFLIVAGVFFIIATLRPNILRRIKHIATKS